MLLTNTQVSEFREAFANNFSTNIKLSKTQLHKIRQWGGFVGKLLRSLKIGLPLMKNVLKPLAKSILIPLSLTPAVLAIDRDIHEKIFGLGTTVLIVLNEEMNDIMKIVKSPEQYGLLIKEMMSVY